MGASLLALARSINLYCIITDCQIISVGNVVLEIFEHYIVKCNKHVPDKLDLF